MALVFPAIALTGFWALAGYAHNAKRTAEEAAKVPAEDPMRQEPFRGPVGHIKDFGIFADTRGQFRSVREDVDVQGARIFWVDYGNGQLVQQYFDPRILL